MNKKVLIIIVAVLLLLGLGFFFMKGRTLPITTMTGNNLTDSSQTSKKSIKDLIASGVSQKCTYKTTSGDGSSEGVFYLTSGNKMRGEFTTVAEGKTTKSNMLVDGKTSWMWTEGEKVGFKMTTEGAEDNTDYTTGDFGSYQGATVDTDTTYDYSCSPWIADSGMFTPPANVEFTSFDDLSLPSLQP